MLYKCIDFAIGNHAAELHCFCCRKMLFLSAKSGQSLLQKIEVPNY